MCKPLLPDDPWGAIKPLLPLLRCRAKGGRLPAPDRAALTGILFVLKTGLPWERLPAEMGYGSGMTCWRRLRDWQQAGVWAEPFKVARVKHVERRRRAHCTGCCWTGRSKQDSWTGAGRR